MSQCFRTLPARLSSFVSGGAGGRKLPSKLDRQLQKNVESSAFLKQFLGTQRTLSVRANTTGKSISFAGCTLPPNLSLTYFDVRNQRNQKLTRRYADDESNNAMAYWPQIPHRLHKSQRLGVALLKNSNRIFLESLHRSQKTNVNENILFISDDTTTLKASPQQPSPQENEGKPSQEQLQSIVDCLSQDLPKLFMKPLNFSIYTDDLIFINNIRGVTTRGLMNYAKQLILLRLIGHVKFAHVKFDIIKITMHSENDTVQVRWRIRGVTGWKVFSMFWKYKIWKIRDAINTNQEVWYDGFSTFYVNANGKIYKHIADKMMPDQDTIAKKENLRIAPKLALFTGLASIFGSDEDSLN